MEGNPSRTIKVEDEFIALVRGVDSEVDSGFDDGWGTRSGTYGSSQLPWPPAWEPRQLEMAMNPQSDVARAAKELCAMGTAVHLDSGRIAALKRSSVAEAVRTLHCDEIVRLARGLVAILS